MKYISKSIEKFKDITATLYWSFWLKHRVSGRVKLRGSLRGLTIAPNFYCDGDFWVGIYSDEGEIYIGPGVRASGPLIITAINKVNIGADVLIGPNVLITDHYHGDPSDPDIFDTPPSNRLLYTRGSIEIQDYAQIGANTVVLSPAKIGFAAILGANSVVTGELQPRTIYAGAPAKRIRHKSTQIKYE